MHIDRFIIKRFTMPISTAGLLIAALFTSGCATGGDLQLDQRDGRVGFDQSRVGSEQAQVLAAAGSVFSVPAKCAASKGGLTHSRKAMFLETCQFNLQPGAATGAPPLMFGHEVLTGAEYDFIDGRLLQMRLRFDAGARDIDALAGSIAALLSDRLQDAPMPLRALTENSQQPAGERTAEALWSSDPLHHSVGRGTDGAGETGEAKTESASLRGNSRDRIDITADRQQRSIAIAIVDARLGPLLIP